MKKFLIALTVLLIFSSAEAQKVNSPWLDFEETTVSFRNVERPIVPQKYRTVKLDIKAFENALSNVQTLDYGQGKKAKTEMIFPMPDGSNQLFKVYEASVMHPDLAAKYPDIKNYAGYGVDDPTAYIRFGISPAGFHAMVRSSRIGTSYIDTYSKADTEHYISYFRKDFAREDGSKFSCKVTEVNEIVKEQSLTNDAELRIGDCLIRTYRIAITADSDYSRFHGGTIPSVLAEINRAVARQNSIFEVDFSLTFELVAGNDELIFLNAATDPFANTGNILGTNNTVIDQTIGDAGYDIGHVFTTGSGGFAGLGVVCNSNSKANGTTGLPNPTGDPFWVEYVAHEIGHQFDANHSFNFNCLNQRNNSTAAEPGSGSTIMSYIGICAPVNIGNEGDGRPFFHAINLNEIHEFITDPNDCAETTTTNNSIPDVTTDGDRILPVSTPFVLTGSATDADGDNLTYGWDQMDVQITTAPPVANASSGPVFEFVIPDETPERYFPNLADLVRNVTPVWEVLPSVSRNMNFLFVVRDNAPGNGCVGTDEVELTFDDSAGPFLVETPNVAATWLVGETQSVTWDVANTDAAPISCGEVDILLSTDGGLTYPITLASGVTNNGSFDVIVPNEVTSTARVMVKCASSYFFDISNQNFSIEFPPEPTFFISVADDELSLCNTEEATFVFSFSTLLGFSEDVNLEVSGVPAGTNASFNNSMLNPNNVSTSILTISNLGSVPTGVYPMTVTAISPSETKTVDLELTIFDGAPAQPLLASPTNGEMNVFSDATLSWNAGTDVVSYLLEVATSPAFGGAIISTQTLAGTTFDLTGLDDNTIYYWRLTPTNGCGAGATSEVFAFRTLEEACGAIQSPNLPITISIPQAADYTDELVIGQSIAINGVSVLLEFDHTYVGDLSASIVSPSGTRVALFERPGVPTIDNFGCPGDDIQAIFDDDAALTSDDFENSCNAGIAIQGIFQPVGQLSDFQGEDAMGAWTLEFSDAADQDGGSLVNWQIEICTALTAGEAPSVITNNLLVLSQNTTETISNTNLTANSTGNAASDIQYSIRRNVLEGTLLLGGVTLAVGDIFTQSDINTGNLSYQHGGGTTATDNFIFDVFNAEGEWLSNQVFNINIEFNTVVASAGQSFEILCNGDNNGEITINGSGGTPPYEYSLNDGTFQTSNIFTQLLPGDYIATVRDANGFERDAGVVSITEPSALDLGSSVADDMITVSVSGGTPFYEYSLNGVDFQSDNIFNNVPNGAYTITVRDANGCLQTTSVVVAVNSLVASASLLNDITCDGADDARIEVIVAGGNAPYTYSLNGTPVQSSNIFENIPAGNHIITVFDADGFQINTNQVLVTNPAAISVNIDVVDDVITINANGGTGVLRYNLNGGNFQTNNVFAGLPNGDYTISIRDDNGCTINDMVNISVNRVTISATLIQDNQCFGTDIAVIEAIAAGGNPPYDYSINGSPFQSSNRFENLAPGNYVITTVDADGFTRASTSITVFGPPEIAIGPDVNGYNITVNASGGAPPYEYSLDGITYISDNVFINNPSGTYTVFVRDANGCLQSITTSVDVLALSLNADIISGILCSGDQTGEVSLTAGGGLAPFEYSQNGTDFQAGNTFTELPAGNYTFTIRDVGGFTSTVDVTITQPNALVLNAPSFGNGMVNFSPTGGTGGYEYSFNGSAFSANNGLMIEVDTDYEVIVRDENGCTTTGTFSVASVQLSSIDVDSDCEGVNGAEIEVFVAGGALPIQYSLDGVNYQDQSTFANVPSGDFQIFVRDAAGFEYSFAGGNVPVYPIVVMTDIMTDNQVTVTGSAGVEPYTYSVDNGPFTSGNIFAGLTNGEHTFTIRDANGCEVTVVEMIGSSSARDVFSQLSFEINPNPSSGNITLKMAQATGQQLNARVFDNTGKLVYQQQFEKFGLTIERNFNFNLAPGSYVITIDDGEVFGRKQLIIIK